MSQTQMQQIERAAAAGREAFARGAMRVPAHDPAVIALIRENAGQPVGTSLPILDAWLQAWDAANLAAPVGAR